MTIIDEFDEFDHFCIGYFSRIGHFEITAILFTYDHFGQNNSHSGLR